MGCEWIGRSPARRFYRLKANFRQNPQARGAVPHLKLCSCVDLKSSTTTRRSPVMENQRDSAGITCNTLCDTCCGRPTPERRAESVRRSREKCVDVLAGPSLSGWPLWPGTRQVWPRAQDAAREVRLRFHPLQMGEMAHHGRLAFSWPACTGCLPPSESIEISSLHQLADLKRTRISAKRRYA